MEELQPDGTVSVQDHVLRDAGAARETELCELGGRGARLGAGRRVSGLRRGDARLSRRAGVLPEAREQGIVQTVHRIYTGATNPVVRLHISQLVIAP